MDREDDIMDNYDLVVTKKDDVLVHIEASRGIARELTDYFAFQVPGYMFMKAYKEKRWDGKIRLFSMYAATLYAGLVDYVRTFAEDRSYAIHVDPSAALSGGFAFSSKQVRAYIDDGLSPTHNGEKITSFPHQVDTVQHCLNNQRALILSPTGSGKSLVIYAMCRFLRQDIPDDKKILLVVPNTTLIHQMYSDFEDYSELDTSYSVEDGCHKIYQGQSKTSDKKVHISTWQSIFKQTKKFFKEYHAVIVDEAHGVKAKSLTGILEKLENCPWRFGFTGTLDGMETHRLVIEGLTGPVEKVVTTKSLMDKDLLSQLKIECLVLQHNKEDCAETKGTKYHEEMDFLVSHERRNNFLTNLALDCEGNTLVLFRYVDKHGIPLHELIEKKAGDNRKVFLVHGGVDADAREEIRKIVETEADAIIVASIGTMSTGVNIERLHNIIFASPTKSQIQVLQSLGRGLRKADDKAHVNLFDVADDLTHKSYENFTLKHFMSRLKIYNQEKFKYRVIPIPMGSENTI